MDAKQVVENAHALLHQAEERIRDHRYLQAVRAGSVPIEALKAIPGHQFHIATSGARSFGLLINRHGDARSRAFFNGVLQGELAALDSLRILARKMGMSDSDLEHYEPTATGFAYATYNAWLCTYGSAAEVACGMLVNFPAWGANCGQVAAGLREHYGFTRDDTIFFDAMAEAPSFEEPVLEIMQTGLDAGVPPAAITRAARLFQAYEIMFWDAMAEIAGI